MVVRRFTDADIYAIRDDTRVQRIIAAQYGVAQTAISNIRRRETYGHVGADLAPAWKRTLEARLMRDVEFDAFGGCWLWSGRLFRTGYGKIHTDGKSIGAHRASWLLFNGAIASGLSVCHRCDIPVCINPDHMFIGTHLDNMTDRKNKGRGSRHTGPARRLTVEARQQLFEDIRRGGGGRLAIARKHGVTAATVRWWTERLPSLPAPPPAGGA